MQDHSLAHLKKEILLAQKNKNASLEAQLLELFLKEYADDVAAPRCSLRLADLYLAEDELVKAYHLYDKFALLHPSHEQAEYAASKAIFAQYKKSLKIHQDCDSTETEKVIQLCNNFITKHGASTHVAEINDIRRSCKNRLIEKETYIFNHYIREGKFQSAEKRLAKLKKNYLEELPALKPQILFLESVLAHAQNKAEKLAEQVDTLKMEFPDSSFTMMASNLNKNKLFSL